MAFDVTYIPAIIDFKIMEKFRVCDLYSGATYTPTNTVFAFDW